jgi:hypothetical protein
MKREEKMQKRREAGKTYSYKKNPYTEGTKEYRDECKKRDEKNKSNKLHYANMTSVFAKLDNRIETEKEEKAKKAREKKAVKWNK